ncbi:uncharacterized protein LAESUDRAFT_759556 [Laetiporus sulphureus 93-53]|uniref:Uncharacterized protein n=1 Tax=Laetiporus sulphureus 93-53 TaxID=1314785 RepID=A0A165E7D3_9APHY|nr:uncharacterized protein LAESUDRAFT_759556 [Laetiporus sulphureus 93-53]KZT06384.1 hypothetical protein LAESUDRAFT_759556 [Laetiporus sulphureus 93-53]
MLKRQRPTSPGPSPDAAFSSEPALDHDLLERLAKRRRYFAHSRDDVLPKGRFDREAHDDGDVDEEEDVHEERHRSEHAQGKAQWQEEAGLYKAANTLLHDLHAEQRHRMIFSSPTAPTCGTSLSSHEPHLPQPSRQSPLFSTNAPNIRNAPHESLMKHSSDYVPDKASTLLTMTPSIDELEVQNVTQRYEDTNRILGSLFLSRKHKLDAQHAQESTGAYINSA